MAIYTAGGDQGMTSLTNEERVYKTDERIQLLGEIDELCSYLGLAKVVMDQDGKEQISKIQKELMIIMAGITEPQNTAYQCKEEQIRYLETEIDSIEKQFPREKKFVLYGGCECSARLDVARAVTRRAERQFYKVKQINDVDANALIYINRLSDYLYILARYVDYKENYKKI